MPLKLDHSQVTNKLTNSMEQWRTEGGGWGVQHPPSRNSEGPPKNRAKLNPIVKTVKKIAEFMMPTPQDIREKWQ